jgi:hypothetical protein
MFSKIITAGIMSAAIIGAAAAQTSNTTGSVAMPTTWAGAISDAFFSDAETLTMRDQNEVQKRYSALPADQRETVKADCAKMKADSGVETSNTTGSGTGAGARNDTTTATMAQICAYTMDM